MLKRTVKLQLTAFFIIALVGVSYVGARYAGLQALIFGRGGCTISADFSDSGGIFTNAEVTYRGIGIGKVGELHLLKDGVRADLDLNSCDNPRIPASTSATVADRSAVGEQYIDLVAAKEAGPYLSAGGNLPQSQNKIPIATQVFLTNLDNLAKSINTDDLKSTLDELNLAFNNRGPDLGVLADSISVLLKSALDVLPQTISLIQTGDTVLKTQVAETSSIQSWADSLNKLTATLKSSNGDINTLLTNGPSAFTAIGTFVKANQDDAGVLFANLTTVNQVITQNIGGVREVLGLFPVAVSDGLKALPGDGTLHFGLVPPGGGTYRNGSVLPNTLCAQGYGGTQKRNSTVTAPAPVNTAAQCTASGPQPVSGSKGASSGINQLPRGAANTPGGDPVSTAGGGMSYNRATTANVLRVGTITNPTPELPSDSAWVSILTSSMR